MEYRVTIKVKSNIYIKMYQKQPFLGHISDNYIETEKVGKQRKKKKAAEIQESIRKILFYDWDPIGINDFGPDDEYDSYVGGIYRLLASGADEYKIIERLYQLETTSMGCNGDRERLKSVAEKLL